VRDLFGGSRSCRGGQGEQDSPWTTCGWAHASMPAFCQQSVDH